MEALLLTPCWSLDTSQHLQYSLRSFANMMPYMASYMRHNTGSDLTYADFIVVHSAWGFTQVRFTAATESVDSSRPTLQFVHWSQST